MPSEQPNENMDKVLKAYAKKRREDSTQIEMDLVTRNMLQAEVKRTLGEVPVPAASRPRPRFAWWPQLIIGVASAAALAVAVLFWKLPSRNEQTDSDVAMANKSLPTYDAVVPEEKPKAEADAFKKEKDKSLSMALRDDAAKPGAPKESKLTEDLAKSVEPRRLEAEKAPPLSVVTTNSIVANADVPATTPAAPAALATSVTSAASVAANAPSGTVTFSAPAPALSTRSVAKSDELFFDRKANVAQPEQQKQQQQRIQFSQVNNRAQYRVNLNSPPLPTVLTNFGLQRTGSNVLVVDADGSTYAGNVLPVAGVGGGQQQLGVASGNLDSRTIAGFAGGEAIPDDNFAFKVSGYNKHLRKKIIFSGSITNSAVDALTVINGTAQSQAVTQNRDRNGSQQSATQNTQNMLLNGNVQVGKTTEFQIQAAPAAAPTR